MSLLRSSSESYPIVTNFQSADSLDMNDTASLAYDPELYDDMPTYEWNETFNPDYFAREITMHNNNLWASVKGAISGKLGIPVQMSGCKFAVIVPAVKYLSPEFPLLRGFHDFNARQDFNGCEKGTKHDDSY